MLLYAGIFKSLRWKVFMGEGDGTAQCKTTI